MPNIVHIGKDLRPFTWTAQSIEVAAMMAAGKMPLVDIAAEAGIIGSRITAWKHYKEFMDKVDELTLEYAEATRAGLLREALYGLDIKREDVKSDRSSHLDYVKEIAELQGLKKQQIEHSGGLKVNVTVTEAVEEYAEVLEGLAEQD